MTKLPDEIENEIKNFYAAYSMGDMDVRPSKFVKRISQRLGKYLYVPQNKKTLVEDIMQDIDKACYDEGNMYADEMVKIRNILIKHLGPYLSLTISTDEGIEKEETTDRIEKARKYYKENTKKYINPEDSFRKAILDNMPKEVKPPTKEPNPTKETIQIEKIDENKWYGPGGSHANGAVEVCQKKINEIISVVNALQSKQQ